MLRADTRSAPTKKTASLYTTFTILFLLLVFSIPARADITTGLVGWWRMEEGSGIYGYDSSGNGNTGTLTLMADPSTPTSGWNSGKFGNGLALDGQNDLVHVANSATLAFSRTDDQSVSVWFKQSATGARRPLITKQVGGGNYETSIYVELGSDNKFYIYLGYDPSATNIQVRSANAFTDTSNWHHYAYTYSGNGLASGITMYYDGAAISTTVISDNLSSDTMTNSSALRIGGRNLGDIFFTGFIDDVRIYNRALSSEDIQTLYRFTGHKAKISGGAHIGGGHF